MPTNFTLSSVPNNPRALQADWTPPNTPNGVIQSYTVTCNGTTGDMMVAVEMTSVLLMLEFQPYTLYECSVFASTNGGMGDASESDVQRTEQDGQLCSFLGILRIHFLLSSSLGSEKFHSLNSDWILKQPLSYMGTARPY